MQFSLFVVVSLGLAGLTDTEAMRTCRLREVFDLYGLYKEGDIILGGIFESHFKTVYPELSFTAKPEQLSCERFDIAGFQYAQTMAFAIEEINRDPALLPNITLGYRLYSNCQNLEMAHRAATALISGEDESVTDYSCTGTPPVLAIVGDPASTHSIAISRTLGLFRIPMVSYYATCSCLSNRKEFPSFFRTIPSDTFQVKAMVQIFRHYGWTWIGVIVSNDDYGLYALKLFTEEVNRFGCIAFTEILPLINNKAEILKIVKTIRESTAKVIAVFPTGAYMIPLAEEIVQQKIRGRQWIASEAWTASPVFHTKELLPYLGGTIGIAIRRGEVPGLEKYLLQIRPVFDPRNNLIKLLWETMFDCKFSESCQPGTRKATRKGEPLCCFDCVPCAEGEISNHTDSIECFKCPPEYWSNPSRDQCVLKKVEFLSYEETLGISLTTVSVFGAFFSTAVLAVFMYYRNTPIVKANNSELSFLLLFSLILCFLCSLLFIGQPLHLTCMLRHVVFGISFVLCISCILVKTIVVIMAFRATLPDNNVMKWFGAAQQRGTVFVFTVIQALICIIWLSTAPPVPFKNTQYQNSKIIFECYVGSVTGFIFLLGYIGLLASVCFVLAFLARNLPDNFNEAKFITFSMLIFCAVWIAFIPTYVSSPGKYSDTVEIFAILASSFGLLIAIFAPKCYIIVLRPEKNTKKALMGRAATKK
nr:PREDICTED: extracellular calcium-sensing receptor-like [Lepisosteus oculatus]